MTAEHDGPSGLDALMAAITDEPLTDEARADTAFLAEHRSAEADIALLREQLGIIGHALAEPPAVAKPAPVRPSRIRRRARTFAFGTLAVTAAAAVVTGFGWLIAQGGDGAMSSGDSDAGASKAESGVLFGSPRYLACARTVAEGEVTRVETLPDAELLKVTVQVTRYFKPDTGKDELTYVIGRYEVTRIEKGDRVLFGVRQDSAVPDEWIVGEKDVARERAWITASLPESRELTCEG